MAMPKISDEKRAARRAQILEAAWLCFQKEGLHATTMDDIIKASGLSAGAVYSYYPSKDDLILAAVATSLSGLAALVEPVLRAEPALAPTELVSRIMETIDRFSTRQGYNLKRIALLGWSEAQRNERLRVTMRGFYLDFRSGLAAAVLRWRGQAPDTADRAANDIAKTLLATILGYVVQSAVVGDVQPAEIVAGLRELEALTRSGR